MKVLVINLGWEQAQLLDKLARRSHRYFGVHYNENVPRTPEFEGVMQCDLRDLPGILDFAEMIQPDAVISDQCDYSLFACAVVADRFGLPGPTIAAAQRGTNKFLMREAAGKAKVPQPTYRLCADIGQAAAAVREIGFPVIVKPVDNRGSFGVNRVDQPEGLAHAVRDAIVNANGRQFLVEKYIEGRQIIVEGYFDASGNHHSVAVGWKTMQRIGSRQIANDIAFTGDLESGENAAIRDHNDRVVRALGYGFGLTSGEYRIGADGVPMLLEVANRGGGVNIASIIAPAVSGIDVTEELVRRALGETAPQPCAPGPKQAAYMHYLLYPPGKYRAVKGLSAARAAPHVATLQWYPSERDGEIRPPRNDAERQGMMITVAETEDAAREAALQAAEQIRIEYR
jgi:biotin carboxylase